MLKMDDPEVDDLCPECGEPITQANEDCKYEHDR